MQQLSQHQYEGKGRIPSITQNSYCIEYKSNVDSVDIDLLFTSNIYNMSIQLCKFNIYSAEFSVQIQSVQVATAIYW